LDSSFSVIEELLQSQDLIFSTEDELFLAVIKWVKFDNSRLSKLFTLISYLNFNLFSRNFLVKIVGEESIIREDKNCFSKLVKMYEVFVLQNELDFEDKFDEKLRGLRLRPQEKDMQETTEEILKSAETVKVFDDKVTLIEINLT
jgi:hypothetical protein